MNEVKLKFKLERWCGMAGVKLVVKKNGLHVFTNDYKTWPYTIASFATMKLWVEAYGKVKNVDVTRIAIYRMALDVGRRQGWLKP